MIKQFFLLLILVNFYANAQFVGINNTDPQTTLDISGALTIRERSFTVASNAVSINIETSLAILTGTASASVAVTCYTPTQNGHRLLIANNTTGGFEVVFAGVSIMNLEVMEFVYTNNTWKPLGLCSNIYTNNDLLFGNRVVDLNSYNLYFMGTGKIGIGTTTPYAKLQVNSNIATVFHSLSTPVTLTNAHRNVEITGSGTITLPTPSTTTVGLEYYIRNSSAGARTLSPGYLNGSGTSVTSLASNTVIHIVCDGTNWLLF